MAITIENAENIWVRRMQFRHFAGSAVYALASTKKLTVEDCISLDPVSEIGGQRRYTFFTKGQQTLFQRLYSEHGYHDFAVGYLAAGPNAFVQCQAVEPFSFSGGIDSWASGVLFDNADIDFWTGKNIARSLFGNFPNDDPKFLKLLVDLFPGMADYFYSNWGVEGGRKYIYQYALKKMEENRKYYDQDEIDNLMAIIVALNDQEYFDSQKK
jgi:hypothetical protein